MVQSVIEGNVPLLPASTSTMTTKLLRLRSPGISDQQSTVIRNQLLLELQCAVSVDVLGVVCDNRLGNGLADGVNLRCVSTTLHTNTDVDSLESLFASNEHGLVDLEAQDLGLEEVDRRAIDVDEATTLLSVGNRSGGLMA